MWPILLDMTKEESMQHLRCLEIDAFSGLVAALRAQGTLNTAKLNLLKETSNMLHISQERHKAEIRRVVNDERLNTIAYHVNGERHCGQEWADEGQRLIPLMPRVAPQTAYAAIADEVADATSKLNKNLPAPASTERKRVAASPPAQTPSSSATAYRDVAERKRKQSFSMENCVLAQHLMAPPKISKIQQIYRQRSKSRLKEQLGRLKYQQEQEKDASHGKTHHPLHASANHAAPKHKINILQNITTAAAKPPAEDKHPRVHQQDKAPAPLRGASTSLDHPGAIASTATTAPTTSTACSTNASKTITTTDGQKLIVVSTHVTPSNHTTSLASSILQRTLTSLPLKNVTVTPRFRVVPKTTGYAVPSRSPSVASATRHRVVSVRPAQQANRMHPRLPTVQTKTGPRLPLTAAISAAGGAAKSLARQKHLNNCIVDSPEVGKVENHVSERISRDVVEHERLAVEVNGVEADNYGIQGRRGVESASKKIILPLRSVEEARGAISDVRGNGHDHDHGCGAEDVPESVEDEVMPQEETEVVCEDKVDLDSSVYIYGDNDNASEEVIIDTIGAPPMEVLNAVHALDESLPNVKNVRS